MHALAVHHHQRLVGRQPAQVGRPDEGGAVTNGIARHREGRDQVLDHLVHVGDALLLQFLAGIDIDRCRRFGDGTVGTPRARDDDRLAGRFRCGRLGRNILRKNRHGIGQCNGNRTA